MAQQRKAYRKCLWALVVCVRLQYASSSPWRSMLFSLWLALSFSFWPRFSLYVVLAFLNVTNVSIVIAFTLAIVVASSSLRHRYHCCYRRHHRPHHRLVVVLSPFPLSVSLPMCLCCYACLPMYTICFDMFMQCSCNYAYIDSATSGHTACKPWGVPDL